jgi:hypothetical protein
MNKPKHKGRGSPALYKGMPPLNPAGRPKGSVNKFTALSRELMCERGPEIVAKVIEKALAGCPHAQKMCMDRILPVQKAIDTSRAKTDAQVIINVSSLESIQNKINETPKEKLINPKEKSEDEVIVTVANDG